MNLSQSADLLWYLMALVLVGAALMSRRVSLGGVLGMALIWVVIFAIVLVMFSYRQELGKVGQHVRNDVLGPAPSEVSGGALRVSLSPDGHFWVNGTVNGVQTRFLVDSGATITALSDDVARSAGLIIEDGPGVVMQTANGSVQARRSSITNLMVGPIDSSDLPVVVSNSFNGINVLGMNFLSRLKSWRVEQNEMVLEP